MPNDQADPNEESKGSDTTQVSNQQQQQRSQHNVYIDSDDEEAEEERYIKVAKKLNKQRSDKGKKAKDGKRRKIDE